MGVKLLRAELSLCGASHSSRCCCCCGCERDCARREVSVIGLYPKYLSHFAWCHITTTYNDMI